MYIISLTKTETSHIRIVAILQLFIKSSSGGKYVDQITFFKINFTKRSRNQSTKQNGVLKLINLKIGLSIV